MRRLPRFAGLLAALRGTGRGRLALGDRRALGRTVPQPAAVSTMPSQLRLNSNQIEQHCPSRHTRYSHPFFRIIHRS